jgi:hypothetical protein
MNNCIASQIGAALALVRLTVQSSVGRSVKNIAAVPQYSA